MVIKILAIGDVANNAEMLRKYSKKTKMHIIQFPNKIYSEVLLQEGEEYFESSNIFKSVSKIESIKEKFDLCFVTSWAGARIAYLADLNYVIYFVGTDILVPPFGKKSDPEFKIDIFNHNFLERRFYKKVLDNAIVCIAGTDTIFPHLKKFRKDAIRIDRLICDKDIFNIDVKPVERKKTKFTFFSPQRFAYHKGMDLICQALNFCKSDFEILQVKWFHDTSEEGSKIMKELMKDLPPQIKFIPVINRNEIARYYRFADAILGQMRAGGLGSVEREAAMCGKPVIHYVNPLFKYLLNGKKIDAPFLPKSNEPKEIAKVIDKVVEYKEFRDNLTKKEYEFVNELCDPEKAIVEWENLFESVHQKCSSIKRNSSKIKIIFRKLFFITGYMLHFKRLRKKMIGIKLKN